MVSQCDTCGSYVMSCLYLGKRQNPEVTAVLVVKNTLPFCALEHDVISGNSKYEDKKFNDR